MYCIVLYLFIIIVTGTDNTVYNNSTILIYPALLGLSATLIHNVYNIIGDTLTAMLH